MRTFLSMTFVAILPLLVNSAFGDSNTPSATLEAGVVVGTTTSFPSVSTGVNKFLGVPFAAPPKRFSPPQEPQAWSQPLNVKESKPSCIQEFVYPEAVRNLSFLLFQNPPPEESEDCLYLNVYAPASPAPPQGRAVLFWIYGGGLRFGYSSHPYYDGSHFAAHDDVIVVAPGYRTNVFGFPTTSELPLEERNLGFLDQRFALDWVQSNIHAFGGDPSKVTIFGESAGAFSIDSILTSFPKNSTPPFRAAIMESGQQSYRGTPTPGQPYPDSQPLWGQLAAALNCTDQQSNLTCISEAPAARIKDIIERNIFYFNPVYDNKTMVANPAQARISGNIARIPILSGTNANEGRVLVYGANNLTAYLETTLGPNLDSDFLSAVLAQYPVGGSQYPTDYDAIAQIETDISLQCGAALVANDTAAAGIPSWRYYFNATFPNTQILPDLRAYHISEIPIVFSTYPRENVTTQEVALSNYMRSTWARFAKDPESGPGWNAIGTGSEFLDGAADLDVAVFSGDPAGVRVARQSELDGRCAFWRGLLTTGKT